MEDHTVFLISAAVRRVWIDLRTGSCGLIIADFPVDNHQLRLEICQPAVAATQKPPAPSIIAWAQAALFLLFVTSAGYYPRSSQCAWLCGHWPGWRRRSFRPRRCPPSGSPRPRAGAVPTPCGGCGWAPARPA